MRFERGGDFEEGKERRSCPAFFHVLHTPATHPSEFRKGFLRNATAHPRLLKADYDFLDDCSSMPSLLFYVRRTKALPSCAAVMRALERGKGVSGRMLCARYFAMD